MTGVSILYYRKAAEIMLRDALLYEERAVALRVLTQRNPRRRDKRLVHSWLCQWVESRVALATGTTATTITSGVTPDE